MKIHHAIVTAAIAVSSSVPLQAADPPILDIAVAANGEIADVSERSRMVVVHSVGVAGDEDGTAVLDSRAAIRVAYDPEDPLFSPDGAFTWILEMRFDDFTHVPHNFPVAGRWESNSEDRVAALVYDVAEHQMQFLVSSDGSAENTSSPRMMEFAPGEWVALVAVYDPPLFSLSRVDSDGGFQKGPARDMAPPIRDNSTSDFLIGGHPGQPLQFRRFRVWSEALNDQSILDALESR